MNVKEIEILMVEDSPSDSELAVEAFKQSRVINNLTIIDNGGDAILYLKRQGKFGLPCFKGGFQFRPQRLAKAMIPDIRFQVIEISFVHKVIFNC